MTDSISKTSQEPKGRSVFVYTLCAIVAAGFAVLSYPHWRSGFSQQSIPVQAEILVRSSGVVSVYWDDPVVDPYSCIQVSNLVPGRASSCPLDIQRSKRGWGRLRFVSEPLGEVTVERVVGLDQNFRRLTGTEFEFPAQLWTVHRQALAATVVTFACILFVLVGAVCIWRAPAPGPRRVHIYLVGLSIILSLFWTAVFFPALMSEDSVNQWAQAVTAKYFTYPAPALAILMSLSQKFAASPALIAFVQGALLWSAAFLLLLKLIPNGRRWLIACALLMLDPALWTCTSVLWRDVWIAISLLFAVVATSKAVQSGRTGWLFCAAALISAAVCFKENAATVMAVPVLAGWGFVWRKKDVFRNVLLAVGIVMVVVVPPQVVSRLPAHLTDNAPAIRSGLTLPSYIGILYRMDRTSQEFARARAAFDGVFGAGKLEEILKAYDPSTGDCLMYFYLGPVGKKAILPFRDIHPHRIFVWKSVLRMICRHPLLFVRHKIDILGNLLQIPRTFYPYHKGIRANEQGLGPRPLLPGIHAWVFSALSRVQSSIFFRHYVAVLVLIVMLFPRFWRGRESRWVVSMTGLLYLFGYMLVDAHAEWRYLLTTYLCGAAGFLSLLFAPRIKVT